MEPPRAVARREDHTGRRVTTPARGQPTWLWVGMTLALLAATGLRAMPLTDNRFHPDEALYASFGQRIANGHDPLLAGVLVDKPPLPFYLIAASLGAFGGGELAARLPSYFASVLSVALLFATLRRLYSSSTALLGAWLLALSPFSILFSITVFIDPLLTVVLLWAWRAASAARTREAAVAMALAFAMKQTAILFVPLTLALVLVRLPTSTGARAAVRELARSAAWMLAALAVTTAINFLWDALRHPIIGFWAQGYADNVPGRLARSGEVLPRARAWVDLLHYITGSTLVSVLGLAALALELWASRNRPARASLADRILAGFCLIYLAGYWLLAFNVWDRYLLPIAPLLIALMARAGIWVVVRLADEIRSQSGVRKVTRRLRTASLAGMGVLLTGILAGPAWGAANSKFPIGGDHGAYDGIDGAAAFLRTLPSGSVLYDHWLSWEWGFYLYDGPVYVSWFPTPDELTTDLKAFGASSPRFLAVPAWEGADEIWAAVDSAGYEPIPVYTAYRRDGVVTIEVYELRRKRH